MTYNTELARGILDEGEENLSRESFKVLESLISAALYHAGKQHSSEGQIVYKALREHRGTTFSAGRVADVLGCTHRHAHDALHFLSAKFWLYSGECGGVKMYRFIE